MLRVAGTLPAWRARKTALSAQNTPPAYLVAEEAIHDLDTFTKDYGPKVPPTLQPYGGRFVVRGGNLTALEGDPPPRLVIIAFDSVERRVPGIIRPPTNSSRPSDRRRRSQRYLLPNPSNTPPRRDRQSRGSATVARYAPSMNEMTALTLETDCTAGRWLV